MESDLKTPKMYCLTAKYLPWRDAKAAERFKEAGLDVEFFYGLNGTAWGLTTTTTVWDAERENPYRISPGQASITISKMMLLQHALDMGDEEIILFENDVKFCDNFKEEFAKSYAALPADWEAVHIGYCCESGKPTKIVNERIKEINWPLCCHALMFKRSAMKLALEQLRDNYGGTPSDTVLAKKVYPKLKHYCFVPQLAFQDATTSEAAKYEVFSDVQGWTTKDILQIYDEQLTGFGGNPAIVVEVGTWKGRSAIYMASEIKRRLKNVQFYCVDTWEGNPDEPDMQELIKDANAKGGLYNEFIRNINRTGVADYIIPLRMTSVEGAAQFKDKSINFCYIDAGHSYENVLADLRAYYPKMAPGSSICGHDIARDSVRRAVKDFCREIGKVHREYEESWIIDGCWV